MVVFGQSGFVRVRLFFEQSGFFPGNMVVFGQKCLYSGKMIVFGQKRFYSSNVVVFVQSNNIRAKWVVIGQKWLYSGKVLVFWQNGCIEEKLLHSGKIGCNRAGLWYSRKSCCIR